MTYRLLALNIDGTILSENARISKQTKDAIEYVKNKGVYVTLVTARPFSSAKKVARALKLDHYLIVNDGAFIATTVEDPIVAKRIKEEKALQLVDFLEQYECHIRVIHEKYTIGNKIRQKNNLMAKMTIGGGGSLFNQVTFVESVGEQLVKDPISPLKIHVQFFDSIEKERALKHLEKMQNGIRVIESTENQIHLVHESVSKVSGLRVLGRHLGIDPKEMVAIGVDVEDVEMITQVGLGVAMGNAVKEAKDAADWITRSNEQNGVSYMIREVFRKQLRVKI
ncbi:HAD family phosphatase [bacterium LRH843]|nr:HAD family phosphatase [bacterium LRH843]